MHFIDHFIKRPVLATVIALLFIVAGLGAALSLQVRQYPYLNNGTITVTTAYPGANPEVIQGFITTPIEASVGTSEGIDYMISQSSLGVSSITIYTQLNADPNVVLGEVVQNVNAVLNQLPKDAESPAINLQSSNSFPSLILGFTSDTMNKNEISAYLQNQLTPQLLALGGLSQIVIWGNEPYAMRVYFTPEKLAQYNMTPNDVAEMLQTNSIIAAGGQVKGPYFSATLNPTTNLQSADAYQQMIVKTFDDGSVLRLGDIARVELGSQSYDVNVTMNGKGAVMAGAVPAADANPLTVVKAIMDNLPEIQRTMPPGLEMEIAYNNTSYIIASIDDVVNTLIEAAIIVSIVLFFFLGSLRSVLVPILAIPLSLIGAFFLMMVMGFSINLLTLLAMVLAIGLVVDDAIVVLENIYRHVEEGATPFAAAIQGAREIANPVILMTLTLVAVYLPIGMMGGFTGILFTEFAYSLAGAVVISGIVAYTFSPMLCSKIVTPSVVNAKMVKLVDKIFDKIRRGYTSAVEFVISVRIVILLFGAIVLFSCFHMFANIKSELAPTEDQAFIGMQGTAPSPSNIYYLDTFSPAIYEAMDGLPGKQLAFVVSGYPQANNSLGGFVMTPWDDRDVTQMEVMPMLQAKLNNVAGSQVYTFAMPSLPGIAYGPPMQFVIQSASGTHQDIYPVANNVIQKMMESGLFVFAQSDLQFDNAQLTIDIDREKASSMQINMADIARNLGYSYSGGYVNWFAMMGYSYQVIPKLELADRMSPEQLYNLYIKTNSGEAYLSDITGTQQPSDSGLMGDMTPLSSIISFQTEGVPLSLNRFQQLNSATISAVPAPGVSQGQAVEFMDSLAMKELPQSMGYQYSGSTRQFVQNSNTMMVAFAFAIIVIFLMLAAQFESFRDPLIILVTVPMAICGALIPLYIGQIFNAGWASLNIYTELGLVTLIGLISKHGILMVEFANKLQEEGYSKYEAIVKSASLRLRPILMTTAAMVFGVLPLVYAVGAGAVSRNSIGIVIASGMTIGTMFTLFVLPCIYMLLAADRKKLIERWKEEDKVIEQVNNKGSHIE